MVSHSDTKLLTLNNTNANWLSFYPISLFNMVDTKIKHFILSTEMYRYNYLKNKAIVSVIIDY